MRETSIQGHRKPYTCCGNDTYHTSFVLLNFHKNFFNSEGEIDAEMARRGLPVNQKRPHAYGTTMDGKYTYSIYIKLKSVITLLQNMVQFVFQFFFFIFFPCTFLGVLLQALTVVENYSKSLIFTTLRAKRATIDFVSEPSFPKNSIISEICYEIKHLIWGN